MHTRMSALRATDACFPFECKQDLGGAPPPPPSRPNRWPRDGGGEGAGGGRPRPFLNISTAPSEYTGWPPPHVHKPLSAPSRYAFFRGGGGGAAFQEQETATTRILDRQYMTDGPLYRTL